MPEITLLGYGNQGRAWAKNLRDSGWIVKVSGRPKSEGGKSQREAASDGFATIEFDALRTDTSPLACLLPDECIPEIYTAILGPGVDRAPRPFLFAHGFSVVYGGMKFRDEDDVILCAPKGIGVMLRRLYTEGSGVMAVLGVEQDGSGTAWDTARAVGRGLGCDRVGMIDSSFAEETNADLLSEQAILCGGLPRILDRSVRFLVEKGIHPKLATFECLNEMKLIVDMMVERGVYGMFRDVSNTAKFGGLRAADRLMPDAETDSRLEDLWKDIIGGQFAKEFFEEKEKGFPRSNAGMERYRDHIADQNLDLPKKDED